MRRQIVLDRKSDKLLKQLTADRDGNYSRTVRQAIQALADQKAMFEAIERDPGFIAMMERSEADIRAGRTITHEELKRQILLSPDVPRANRQTIPALPAVPCRELDCVLPSRRTDRVSSQHMASADAVTREIVGSCLHS